MDEGDRDQHVGSLCTGHAPTHKGGVTRFRLLCGTWEPVVAMVRENLKRRPRKRKYRCAAQGRINS